MNINEFEKTLLTNKITPVELSSDDLHRTKIINKWTKTDEDRAWMFFETICRIAVPIFVSFQIIQIVFFMLLSGKDFILGIMQVMLCACLDATVLFFLSIFTYGFLIIKAYCDCKKITVFQLKSTSNYKDLSCLLVLKEDIINLSERAIARKYYYKDPVVVYKLAKSDAYIYCGVRQKGKKMQVVFERPICFKNTKRRLLK